MRPFLSPPPKSMSPPSNAIAPTDHAPRVAPAHPRVLCTVPPKSSALPASRPGRSTPSIRRRRRYRHRFSLRLMRQMILGEESKVSPVVRIPRRFQGNLEGGGNGERGAGGLLLVIWRRVCVKYYDRRPTTAQPVNPQHVHEKSRTINSNEPASILKTASIL